MSSIYQEIIREEGIRSIDQLNNLFDEKISEEWVYAYNRDSQNLIGDITIQKFFNFTFVYDYTGNPLNDGIDACSLPDSRVVGVFGMANIDVKTGNRSMMKKFLGKPGAYDCLGGKYDRGHFIAHLSGGPIDINLFPQRRDIIEDGQWREKDIERWRRLSLKIRGFLFFPGHFIEILVVALTKLNSAIVLKI